MVNKRIEELMNKAIDETLSPEEEKKLNEILASDPEARNQFENLKTLDQTLRRVPPIDPPQKLSSEIMQAVRERAEDQFRKMAPSSSTRLIVRYAYAVAAGIVITLVSLSLFTDKLNDNDFNRRFLTGTAIKDIGKTMSTVAVREFSDDGLSGKLQTLRLQDTVSALIEVSSMETLELVVDFSESDLAFQSFVQEKSTGQSLNISASQVRIVHKGMNSYILTFTDISDSTTDITLRVYAADAIHLESVTTGNALTE